MLSTSLLLGLGWLIRRDKHAQKWRDALRCQLENRSCAAAIADPPKSLPIQACPSGSHRVFRCSGDAVGICRRDLTRRGDTGEDTSISCAYSGGNAEADFGQPKSRRALTAKVTLGPSEVRGAIEEALIRRSIQHHLNEVKFCYESELNRTPNIQGHIEVKFFVGPMGSVAFSVVDSSTVGSRCVEECILSAVRRWAFPKPKSGSFAVVTTPFTLTSGPST